VCVVRRVVVTGEATQIAMLLLLGIFVDDQTVHIFSQ
jgi:hypothetical protein